MPPVYTADELHGVPQAAADAAATCRVLTSPTAARHKAMSDARSRFFGT
jgi:hypothetical protein